MTPPAGIAAELVDRMAPDGSPAAGGGIVAAARRRRAVTLIALGLIAYAVGLVAMIPARVLVAERIGTRVGGTIWRGEAVIGPALRVTWRWSPIASLAGLGFGADWHATGGGTDLAGAALRRPGRIVLRDVAGTADRALLDALAPDAPFTCRFDAQLRIDELAFGGRDSLARGTVRSSPAHCETRGPGGAALAAADLPALRGDIVSAPAGSSATLTTIAARQPFAEMRLSRDGALSLWPTAAAVRGAPFLAQMRYDGQVG